MHRGIKILIALASAVIIPGGFIVAGGVYLLTKICYKINGFKIISANATYVEFELSLKVKNPSHLAVTIDGYNFDVSLNNTVVAQINNTQKKVLASNEVSILTIPVKVAYKLFFNEVKSKELILNFISRRLDKILVTLNGKFIGEMVKIPISKKIKINYTVAQILEEAKKPGMPCDLVTIKN